MKNFWLLLVGVFIVVVSTLTFAKNVDDLQPNLAYGAKIYYERCTLCHGDNGYGEGTLPIKLKDYPSTNLLQPRHPITRKSVHDIIVYGDRDKKVSSLMPPFGDELTWIQIESIVDFIMLLRKDKEAAASLIDEVKSGMKSTKAKGMQIYMTRCVLCHGKYGEGNGRMKKVVKNPSPADLTASRLPDDYLKKMISLGGQGVERSPQMPPWKDQLSKNEIDSVILYIKSIRD